MPVECEYTADELARIALGDKKRSGSTITLVIPEIIGRCRLEKVGVYTLVAFAANGIKER